MESVTITKVKNGYIINYEEKTMPLEKVMVFNEFNDLVEYLKEILTGEYNTVYDAHST